MASYTRILVALLLSLYVLPTFAQARGYFCGHGGICTITGTAVAIIAITILVFTINAAISEKGVKKGIGENGCLVAAFLYLVNLVTLVCVVGFVARYNSEWAIIAGIITQIVIYFSLSNHSNNNCDNNKRD